MDVVGLGVGLLGVGLLGVGLLGARAPKTQFILLITYNLLSKRNRDAVIQIKEMGHKVSLHFDPTAYDSLEVFLEERRVFEKAFKTEIDIVSIHRPNKFLENNNIDLYGTKQTYQDRFFKKDPAPVLVMMHPPLDNKQLLFAFFTDQSAQDFIQERLHDPRVGCSTEIHTGSTVIALERGVQSLHTSHMVGDKIITSSIPVSDLVRR
jgi:hypothetical protein